MAIDHEPRGDDRGHNEGSDAAGDDATGARGAGRADPVPDDAQKARAHRVEPLRRQSYAGVWALPPVAEAPGYSLVDWRILERDGEMHFVGRDAEERVGRVSSPIQQFDPAARRGVTRSGRQYILVGPPGWDADAAYVLEAWLAMHRVSRDAVRDATAEMIALSTPFVRSEGA